MMELFTYHKLNQLIVSFEISWKLSSLFSAIVTFRKLLIIKKSSLIQTPHKYELNELVKDDCTSEMLSLFLTTHD